MPWLTDFLSYGSYYFIFALVFTWVLVVVGAARHSGWDLVAFCRRYWKALLFTFLAAAMVFVSVPKYFRVLSDETNLLSVARSMTYEKRVDNVSEGKAYYERFWPGERSVEKRAYMFPFFTHLTHAVLGYDERNVFVLNFFALWGFLFSLYMLLMPYVGARWSAVALVLVLAQPVICLSATSGSYEIFNMFFVVLSFLAVRWFINERTAVSFQVMVFNLLVLANIRYESIVFLVTVIALLVFFGYLKKQVLASSLVVTTAPLLMLPWVAQRIVMIDIPDSNLIHQSWVKSFAVDNMGHNYASLFSYLLNVDGSLGFAGILDWAGVAAIFIMAGYFIFRERRLVSFEKKVFLSAILLACVLQFLVVISYQGNITDHPLNGRMYFPLVIFLSVVPVLALSCWSWDRGRGVIAGLLVAGSIFVYYHPVAVEDKLSNNLFIVRENRYVRDFLSAHADRNVLVISGRPGQLVGGGYGSISYSTANQEKDTIVNQFRNHLFSDIYVVQSIDYRTLAPLSDNVVDPAYELEPVSRLQITGSYFFQISKVKNHG